MKRSRRWLLQAGGAAAGMSAVGVLGRAARASVPAAAVPAKQVARAAEPAAARSAQRLALGAEPTAAGSVKRVALNNVHTGESLDVEFFRGGDYVPESLAAIKVLLRDFRNDEQHVIDPTLMDYLHTVARVSGVEPVFSVISGYRSPQTNEQLRERSSGVARHSLHLEGRAIDVRLAGIDCADLAARALELTRGGVGYYRRSDFVHLDTGAFRTWKG